MKHFFIFLSVIVCAGVAGHFVFASRVQLTSVNDSSELGNDDSESSNPVGRKISSDGRYVVFSSVATNLVSGDTNGTSDVFIYDRTSETTERLSVDSLGVESDGSSYFPATSSDGRYVAFQSDATNLVAGDTNGLPDIFVHDRQTDTTERVSVDSLGVEADGDSQYVSISEDGRYVAFGSNATNLVAGDTNGTGDVFVYDRQTDTTERVSVDSLGVEGDSDSNAFAAISSDGRYVVFSSTATNLVSGDINNKFDIFVHDRQTDTTERVSVDSSENEADGDTILGNIYGGGRYVVFESHATNLVSGDTNASVDVFLRDRDLGTTERISLDATNTEANNNSFYSTLTPDARYVVFQSTATDIVTGDTNGVSDIFIRDLDTETNTRISVSDAGVQGNAVSSTPDITSDGRYVIFYSSASNLVSGDTNGKQDVFVYDAEYEEIESAVVSGGVESSGFLQPHISLQNYATQTSSQIVNLVAHIPSTTTFYEISNTPDFTNRQIFIRDGLEKILRWDICNNLKTCELGQKKIYARFYNPERMISEQVLEIDYLVTKECPYFKQYLRMGSKKNNPEEVIKMQAFLNTHMGENLSVDGYFGKSTYESVKRFQERYPDQIIKPWPTLDHSTGWWYITTSGYANVLVGC